MKWYFFILGFISITYAQELQYDYKVKIYPVSNLVKADKTFKATKPFQYRSSMQKNSQQVILSNDINANQNLKEKDIKVLLYKLLKEVETNRKLIKNIKNTYDEKKIIEKLEKIIQDKLYLSRKYTYAYIKKVLEEYQNEIKSILEESQDNLKRDLENKIIRAKNDISSLITQSSSEIKTDLDSVKGNIQQISVKIDEISQSQESLKNNMISSFNFIKYFLIAISIIIVISFVLLAIKINKISYKENSEEEE